MKRSFLVILSAVLVLGGCGGGGTTPATDTGKAQGDRVRASRGDHTKGDYPGGDCGASKGGKGTVGRRV